MSSQPKLGSFSYAILALVGREGASPHDIVRMMREERVFWTTSESHFYAEPKRLAKLGYLDAETMPGQTRERTHYTLTARGREALRAWAREPTRFPRIQAEGTVRLLAGDVVEDDAGLLASLDALRAELDEIEAALDLGEAAAAELPHRERYLLLVHGFGRRLVQAHREWLEEVERELGPG